MNPKTCYKIGGYGTVVSGLCCFGFLGLLFGLIGASAALAFVNTYGDYVFIPAYLIFGAIFIYGLLIVRKDWVAYSISTIVLLIGVYLLVTWLGGGHSSHATEAHSGDASHLSEAQEQFEHVCKSEGKGWMKMAPRIDGVPTGGDACFGCMPNANTHICDLHEYKEYVKHG